MKFIPSLLIIIFFLTLAYSVNAETTQVSGSTPLNFSVYEIISADTVLITANVTENSVVSINATNITSTSVDFVSNTSLGNVTIVITRYTTSPVDINLSSLNVISLKYVNMSANNTLNSSVLAWTLIKIHYTDSELDSAGVAEDSLAMYWYNITSSQWVQLTTSSDSVFDVGINTTAKYVWTNSTLFSLYAIGGLKSNDQSCSADAECYSNICCSGICQSSCPTVATTTPSGGGDRGRGPAKPPEVVSKISSFTIDKDFIKILLKLGIIERKLINISNTGDTNLTITMNMENLQNFLIFPGGETEITFDLKVGRTKSIQLNFFVSEEQEPGVFPGKIVVTGNGIEEIITVIVEIESEKALFDIDVEIPQRYKEVLPGEEVIMQLSIYNVERIGRVDVEIEYGLKDLAGNIIASENEVLAVEMQVSIVRSLNVPFGVKPGSYVLYAEVKYDDTIGTGTDIFSVIEKKEVGIQTIIILSLFLITVVMVSAFLLIIRFVERRIKELPDIKDKL
jgi:hypothetical protein